MVRCAYQAARADARILHSHGSCLLWCGAWLKRDLKENRISTIPRGVFAGIKNLHTLFVERTTAAAAAPMWTRAWCGGWCAWVMSLCLCTCTTTSSVLAGGAVMLWQACVLAFTHYHHGLVFGGVRSVVACPVQGPGGQLDQVHH